MTYRLAPGHVLQFLYVKQRLNKRGFRTFVEAGAGTGQLSRELLKLGLTGTGFDLNPDACGHNSELNALALAEGRYAVRCEDFLTAEVQPVDVIISSMVIEHLTAAEVHAYFSRCRQLVRPGGIIVTIVPASPRHWGIEDDVAGHQRRYTRSAFEQIARDHGLRVSHVAGLTYPLSNLLLSASNRLVRRSESWKLGMDAQARTIASGDRHVRGKTEFPGFVRYLVNEVTLYPLHLIQRMFRGHPDALVLYAELEVAT
jgi:cyclopropane fatty-acyl-phospholipid synthase-like methyltransferase